MFSVLSSLKSLILGAPPPAPDLDSIISQFSQAVDKFGLSDIPDPQELPAIASPGCFYKTGTITSITTEYLLIDDTLYCDLTNCAIRDPQIGTKVDYLAYQKSLKDDIKIRKILSAYDSAWDNFVDDSPSPKIVENQLMKRCIVARVMRREGRLVFLQPMDITINLDSIDSTFVPYVGDWVKVDCFVELDEQSSDLGGVVLEAERLQPLRSSLKVGLVSHFDPKTGTGGVDADTIFSKVSCQPGYVPSIGDKVACDCIESDQGEYTWRCLSVVPLQINNSLGPSEEQLKILEDREALMRDKNGLEISDDLSILLDVGEEKTIDVIVQNFGDSPQFFLRGIFMSKKSQSQLTLQAPDIDVSQRLNPSQSIRFAFKVSAKFVGLTEELFIFSFRGFKIGRTFQITVNAKISPSSEIVGGCGRNKLAVRGNDCDQENYVPGVRPHKPTNFVAVKQRTFKVPRRLWDVILPIVNERRIRSEAEVILGDEIPCLNEGLTLDNYRYHFHNLLYLEEISLTIDMQKYDMESASLRRSDEFLALQVPGLSERRPSLMIGDRAVVSFKWDASRGDFRYEGCIHRVTSSEVFMKFNQRFHNEYQGEDCQVTFKSSYSPISKCHNAIDVAVKNLTREILFPTCVKEKAPQVILHEVGVKDNEKMGAMKKNISKECNLLEETEDTRLINTERCNSPGDIPESVERNEIQENGDGKSQLDQSDKNDLEIPPESQTIFHKNVMEHGPRIDAEMTEKSLNKNVLEQIKTGNVFPGTRQTEKILEKIEIEAEVPDLKMTETKTGSPEPRRAHSSPSPHENSEGSPTEALKFRKLVWFNKSLNMHQKTAVKNVLLGTGRPLPYVIFGPPGTGKTITLCETILQILTTLPQSRLLIATPSNSSANLISERLLDSGALNPGDLVRLIANHCLQDDSIPERLLPFCATGNIASESSAGRSRHFGDGPKVNCTMSVLGRHRVTIGTCIALGQLHQMGFPRGHFSHILVDEAGQATEPEIMVPLTLIEAHQGQIVLAGDPMQLGPVVNSKFASSLGLGESFLVRLLQQFPYQKDPEGFTRGYDPRLVTKLVVNYRSLPEILELPNYLFYDLELEANLSEVGSEEGAILEMLKEALPERNGRPPAIVFHGVNGEEKQDEDSPSWYNPAEATQVYLYLLKLYACGLSGKDIGIIAPYQKQVKRIRELLMELDVTVPKIGSVEEFQGQERTVIILSAVRSGRNFVGEDVKHALGFVASPRRLNVAITRARALLIILGNPMLLQGDPYWRSVIMYCVRNESYTGCYFIPEGGDEEIEEEGDGVVP